MNDLDIQGLVAAEYLALAGALGALPAAAWTTPSLCDRWTVRELIAHLTMPARYDEASFMAELAARDFDFNRLSDDLAARDGRLPLATLLANLRDDTLHRWTPPGGGARGALNHVVIHGLDAALPLGLDRRPSEPVLRVVLDDLTEGGVHRHFGTTIEGRRLEASDLDWSYGAGPAERRTAAEHALVLSGRRLPAHV